MKLKTGLTALLGLTGCIFVHSHETPSLLVRGQSEAFESKGNHVAVDYYGPLGSDSAEDDYIVVKSYGPESMYTETSRFISSGDTACVLGIRLDFDIANDDDGNRYNNILGISVGRCRR